MKNQIEGDPPKFIRSLKEPETQESMKRLLSPALVSKNFFIKEELEWLYGFAFKETCGVRHNPNGTIFLAGNLRACYERFKEKIDTLLPEAKHSPCVGGNFFITPSQYGLHNDSPREADYLNNLNQFPENHSQRQWVPWKNLIIPIWVAPYRESELIFFEQRHIDWAHVYNHKNLAGKTATTYPVVDDVTSINFYNSCGEPIDRTKNSIPFDQNDFNQFFCNRKTGKPLTPKERLTGLTIESAVKWIPGSAITFDAVQLHATNCGETSEQGRWTLKLGLLLTFLHKK